jgi:hypothetical protein
MSTSPNVLIVNMIPKSLSGETEQDSEPMLAVNPKNPKQIVGTAFTPDPFGSNTTAPIYVSTDGGNTWSLISSVPSAQITGDITVAFGPSSGDLYASILQFPSQDTTLAILRTDNFQAPTAMKVLAHRDGVDQPFVQAAVAGGAERVYVGENDFGAPPGRTSTVEVSADGAKSNAKFKALRIESRGTQGQNGPQVRPACHSDGTVYAAYYRWVSTQGNFRANTLKITADVTVVRDDNGAGAANAFRSLVDTDGLAGKRVAQGVVFPFHVSGGSVEGQQRLGGDISIAVDPRDSKTVYLSYCDVQNDTYTLHLRRSLDGGVTWSNDLRTIDRGINCALAINSDGVVGMLYQQMTGSAATLRWVTHFRRTTDNTGANWDDTVLATTPANAPVLQFDPYLGDYDYLLAVGKDFFGIFAANNTPDPGNFPSGVVYQRNHDFNTHRLMDLNNNPVDSSIDPFFFRVSG